MNARAAAAVLAACLAGSLVLGACSGDDDPAAAAPGPSANPTPGPGPTCSDPVGDSADPVLDLTSVRLTRVGKEVRVAIDENGYPPGDRQVDWVIGFLSADGSESVELATKLRDGGDPSHAVITDDESKGVAGQVRITPVGMATSFPVKAVDALGLGTKWYVTLSVDGSEIDFCPGGADLREVLDVTPMVLPDRW